MSYFGTTDYLLEVSRGNVAGAVNIILRGHNTDLDSGGGFEDLWEEGGVKTYLTFDTDQTVEVASDNAADTSAGTGARTVFLHGVDNTGAYTFEIITMNGVTDVTSSNSYMRVNGLIVLTAGSGEVNAGMITATFTTAATVQAHMDAGDSLAHDCQYTVPLAKKFFINRMEFSAAKISGGGSPVLNFQVQYRTYGTSSDAPWLKLYDVVLDTSVQNIIGVDMTSNNVLSGRDEVRIQAESDTNNTEARSRMYGVLIDD